MNKIAKILLLLFICIDLSAQMNSHCIIREQGAKSKEVDSIRIRSLYWNVRSRSQITPERFWSTRFQKSEKDFFDTTMVYHAAIDSILNVMIDLQQYSIKEQGYTKLVGIDTRLSIQLFYNNSFSVDTISFGRGNRYRLQVSQNRIIWNSKPFHWHERLINAIIQILPSEHQQLIPTKIK